MTGSVIKRGVGSASRMYVPLKQLRHNAPTAPQESAPNKPIGIANQETSDMQHGGHNKPYIYLHVWEIGIKLSQVNVVLSRAFGGTLKLPYHVVVKRFLSSLNIVPGVLDDVLSTVKTSRMDVLRSIQSPGFNHGRSSTLQCTRDPMLSPIAIE